MVHSVEPFNAEPPPAVLAAGEITPADAFYCRNHGPIPDIDADGWHLTVGGHTLTYADLTALATHGVTATLECAGNRRAELLAIRPMPGREPWAQCAISTAVWGGARLADVLAAAGIDHSPDAHVAFTGADVTPHGRFGGSIPLAKALADETLLAWAMNDAPLQRIHGGPVRALVPGFIGARSVKWLTGITVQPGPSRNYYQAVDYRLRGTPLTAVQLNCAILTPQADATVQAGPLTVRGYAVAADAGRIGSVEVSVDNGSTWRPAALAPPVSRWAWRRWSLAVDAEPGPLGILARAVDGTGATQPESAAALWNPDGYANNAWAHVAVTVIGDPACPAPPGD